jgi:hypothetical protein
MKAEERHRLHEHELRKLALRAGDFWKQHGMKVLAAVAVVAAVVIGILIWTAGSRESAAEAWRNVARSGTAEQFTAVAEDYAGDSAGHWARLRAAELHLQEGVRQAFSNRGAAVDELEESVEQFARLLSADLPDKLHERALYGHGRALEAMAAVVEPSEGKVNATLDDAIAAYERLLKTFPETIYKPLVEEQIKSLKAERTQQFVAWFRQQEPKPSDRALPQDGLPGGDASPLPPFMSPGAADGPGATAPASPGREADPLTTPATPRGGDDAVPAPRPAEQPPTSEPLPADPAAPAAPASGETEPPAASSTPPPGSDVEPQP